jgi:hypothetical protein
VYNIIVYIACMINFGLIIVPLLTTNINDEEVQTKSASLVVSNGTIISPKLIMHAIYTMMLYTMLNFGLIIVPLLTTNDADFVWTSSSLIYMILLTLLILIVYIKTKDSLQLTIFILSVALILLYCAPLLFIYVF